MTGQLLQRLIARGDAVGIYNGELTIVPASGRPIPSAWLEEKHSVLTLAILELTGDDCLVYHDYTTGIFMKGRAPGVQLRFTRLLSGEAVSIFFNADLARHRNTKAGKAGTPLPAGHFSVGKWSAFVKFWLRIGLRMPRYYSEFYEQMGLLRGVLLDAKYLADGRIDKGSIKRLTISPEQILQALIGSAEASGLNREHSGKSPVGRRETVPGRILGGAQCFRGLQPDQSAGIPSANNVSSVRGNGVISYQSYPLEDRSVASGTPDLRSQSQNAKDPRDKTVEEWYADHDRAQSLADMLNQATILPIAPVRGK